MGIKGTKRYTYTVYDNKTGFPIAVGMSATECAVRMKISAPTFRSYRARCKRGEKCRWAIVCHDENKHIVSDMDLTDVYLPQMVRLSVLARVVGTTVNRLESICTERGVDIIRAGPRKIKMISSKKFKESIERGRAPRRTS